MKHTVQACRNWVTGSLLTVSLSLSGCITISPNAPGLSWKSLTKPKIQRASYEEKVEEAPGDPKHPAKLKLAYGRLMEESGQVNEARRSYLSVTEIQPKNVEAILGLARLDQLSGNLEQAEQNFKRAVKIAPTSASAQFGLGQFHASQKQWKEASEALTKAMLAEPDESQYRYALAVSLVHCGDVDSALPHFIRTIGDAEAHYNVGLILQEEGKLDEAERQFSLAVTKKPELTAAQNWLAHLRQQREAQALAAQPAPPAENFTSPIVPTAHRTQTPAAGTSQALQLPVRQMTEQQREQAMNQVLPAGG